MSVKLIFCLRRRPELTRQAFQLYWLEKHAPLVTQVADQLGMSGYLQCHTLDSRLGDSFAATRGTMDAFDGVMEGWWDSEDVAAAALRGEGARAAGALLLRDEATFMDLERSSIFLTREHRIY